MKQNNLEQRKKIKYLGLIITLGGKLEEEIKERTVVAGNKYSKISLPWMDTSGSKTIRN